MRHRPHLDDREHDEALVALPAAEGDVDGKAHAQRVDGPTVSEQERPCDGVAPEQAPEARAERLGHVERGEHLALADQPSHRCPSITRRAKSNQTLNRISRTSPSATS